MLLRLAYLGVTNAVALLRLLPMSDRDKDTEIRFLRHQIAVLQRQLSAQKPRFPPPPVIGRCWRHCSTVCPWRCSQSDAEFGFRQLKDLHVVSFSPMHHWTDHNIRIHTQTCVFALMIAHLMRRHADKAGLTCPCANCWDQLAGIQETVLIYPSTGGRPKARRMLTETNPTQDRLTEIFDLKR